MPLLNAGRFSDGTINSSPSKTETGSAGCRSYLGGRLSWTLCCLRAAIKGAKSLTTLNHDRLRGVFCDEGLPGITYMFVWGKLDEGSEGHIAFSQVLFAHESVENPDDAPNRDLSDPSVRQGVFDCAMRYSDVRKAIESVLTEISASEAKRQWWKFW
jgi:hypothetical protein